MASQLDAKFFRKAKKLNRAVEITDNQAFIPAVKDSPEIRVQLPNRRPKTIEERTTELNERTMEIAIVEEQIEVERKALLELVKVFKNGGPASEVVAQNLKVKGLMEKRSSLARPAKWIEELSGLSFKDVFASKRDDRKIGAPVYQVKRRVEPITSLYVDLAAAVVAAEPIVQAPELPAVKAPVVKTAAEVAQGAIIGQKKRTVIKLGKPPTGPPS
jgi:hypothetical protein